VAAAVGVREDAQRADLVGEAVGELGRVVVGEADKQ